MELLSCGGRTITTTIYAVQSYLAEREGFEPSVRFEPYARFPGVYLKPLGHLSCRGIPRGPAGAQRINQNALSGNFSGSIVEN
jgi:hypothetical protein